MTQLREDDSPPRGGANLFQQHPDWFVKGDDGKPQQSLSVALPRPGRISDFWRGAELGRREGTFQATDDMPPHAARPLVCKPV